MRVFHAHHAAFDAQDPVRDVSELEDISLQTLDCEVFVDRADELRLRLQHHPIVGVVGNRASRCDGREPGAAPATDQAIDRIVMNQGAMPAPPRRKPFREHAQYCVEFLTLQIAKRIGAAQQREQSVLVPLARRNFRHDLLRNDVQRLGGHHDPVQLTAPHGVQQRCAFDEIVTRQGKQPAFRCAANRMTRSAHTLQKGCDRAWGCQLADQIDVADIDSQLQGCGCDQRLQLTSLEAGFGVEPQLFRHAAVVRGDFILADPLG